MNGGCDPAGFAAFIQVNRSFAWIGWWCLYTIALRIIMARLFSGAGKSVAGVALFHAISNVSTIPFINEKG